MGRPDEFDFITFCIHDDVMKPEFNVGQGEKKYLSIYVETLMLVVKIDRFLCLKFMNISIE